MSESQFLLFIITSLVVIMVPGQDLVLVMSRGMAQGAKAGLVTAAGVSVGLLGHTLLAGLGLGALLMSSDLFFTVLKYVGAAYLSYLGLRLIFSKADEIELESKNQKPLNKLFLQGALSNLSNPKVTIFYFSFLPQFISSDTANPTAILLLLGATFALLTFLMKAPIGFFSGKAANWIRNNPVVLKWINRLSGTMLIGLGVKLALEER